ncbi:putative calcium-transporting atpase 4, endoplasmic reticulum-type [Capsicum annuum]|uniref:Pentatricopeptide repeat-containing protein n=1 Tax=Capsicum annuum TaxID=4072 RepID=A0A2G2ZT17_CAPAN|nr:putative calcium-transporting atpase 4, endoplasmic reticulum-type [Capsicum annuum]PHT85117.1 hypothetical protein T459_13560 [Capsicum annuum]
MVQNACRCQGLGLGRDRLAEIGVSQAFDGSGSLSRLGPQLGKYVDALPVYKEMEKAGGVKPNEVKISSVLLACANLMALEVGEKIKVYARASGYFKNMFVCNAVLEMYTKCVRIDRAMQLFHEIGRRRNLCSWNTMIMGLAVHGKSD